MSSKSELRCWRTLGASVPGISHIEQGLPCQDHFAIHHDEKGGLLAVISDGAGSAEFGGYASYLAVSLGVDYWNRQIKDHSRTENSHDIEFLLRRNAEFVRESLLTEAQALNQSDRELSCTYIIIYCDEMQFFCGQIGDGAVVVKTGSDQFLVLTTPQIGEFCNQTNFLIMKNFSELFSIVRCEQPVQYFCAFTDGLQNLALVRPAMNPHPPFFHSFFQFIHRSQINQQTRKQLISFLTSPKVTTRTDDDLTILLGENCCLNEM